MSVIVRKRGKKYRVTDYETGEIITNRNGKPMDGGGHDDEMKAERQVAYINGGKDASKSR